MKAIVLYKPEIHKRMIEELDKEIEKALRTQREGVKLVEKKVKLPGGKQVVIGKEMNKKVNTMLAYTFNYEVVKEGEIIIEFKSLADKIPMINKYTEKTMKKRIKKEMKKEFGNKIIKIK